MTDRPRLARQLEFIAEVDKLKRVLRMTSVMDESRRENSAEHSWHLAVMAPLLAEYGPPEMDLLRAMKMVVVHDVVEIDAGDTFAFDDEGKENKEERETRAAERLFGLLPPDQAAELRSLWDEFEARETPEARFANALDRLSGLLQNYHNEGGTWRVHEVPLESIRERMAPIRDGAPEIWPFVRRVLDEAVEAGWVEPGNDS